MQPEQIVLAQAALPSEYADRHGAASSMPWMVLGERALPLRSFANGEPCGRVASITGLVEKWSTYEQALRELTTSTDVARRLLAEGIMLDTLELDAPVRPRQVFCTIGNYRRQVVQAAVDSGDGPSGAGADARLAETEAALRLRRDSGEPYICLTSPGRVAPPVSTLPITAPTLDWEVEIGAVLANVPHNADPADSTKYIAGFCTANDVTLRAKVARTDLPALGSDWVQSKGLPGSLPLGPWFVPAWQVPDPAALRLRLWVNDRLMQDDHASDMVFDVAEQVAYLSRNLRLQPADLICTGSPAGFGAHYGRYLQPGDLMVAEVSGLGRQQVRCIGAVPAADHAVLEGDATDCPLRREQRR